MALSMLSRKPDSGLGNIKASPGSPSRNIDWILLLAQSALAIIESGLAIDLLFTDVVMPGTLRSPELARKARERIPTIAVLFTSGYTENAIIHHGRLDEGVLLLAKPYRKSDMAIMIRKALTG